MAGGKSGAGRLVLVPAHTPAQSVNASTYCLFNPSEREITSFMISLVPP